MTSMSIESFRPSTNGVLRADLGRSAPLPFVAFAAVLIIIAYTAPFHYAWAQSTYDDDPEDDRSAVTAQEGAILKQITLGTLGLVGLATLALSRERFLRMSDPLSWIFIGYLAWCAATCFWSDSLSITSRRALGLGCEALAGIAIAQRASPRQFVWLVFTCTLSWLCLGILAEVVHGTLRPWQANYRFDGIFYPNIMAGNCVLLFLSALYLHASARKGKRVLQVVIGMALTFLVLTGSRTALGTLIVLFAIAALVKTSTSNRALLAWTAALAAAGTLFVAGLGVLSLSTDWVAMGRKDHDMWSLTGRVPLWQELIDQYARNRPLAGHGYGAFWTPIHIDEVAASQGWSPAYAHSTYIDLVLSIGMVGAFLFVCLMVATLIRAARLEVRYANSGYGFIAMLIGCILLDGVLETTFGNTSFTSFFAICGICCVLSAAGKRKERAHESAIG